MDRDRFSGWSQNRRIVSDSKATSCGVKVEKPRIRDSRVVFGQEQKPDFPACGKETGHAEHPARKFEILTSDAQNSQPFRTGHNC